MPFTRWNTYPSFIIKSKPKFNFWRKSGQGCVLNESPFYKNTLAKYLCIKKKIHVQATQSLRGIFLSPLTKSKCLLTWPIHSEYEEQNFNKLLSCSTNKSPALYCYTETNRPVLPDYFNTIFIFQVPTISFKTWINVLLHQEWTWTVHFSQHWYSNLHLVIDNCHHKQVAY